MSKSLVTFPWISSASWKLVSFKYDLIFEEEIVVRGDNCRIFWLLDAWNILFDKEPLRKPCSLMRFLRTLLACTPINNGIKQEYYNSCMHNKDQCPLCQAVLLCILYLNCNSNRPDSEHVLWQQSIELWSSVMIIIK